MAKPVSNPPASAESTKKRPRVLVVTDVPYWTLDRGSCRRIASMIEHLIKHFDVSICFVGEMPVPQWNKAERFFKVPFFGPGQPSALARRLERFLHFFKTDKNTEQSSTQTGTKTNPAPKRLEEFRSDVIGQYVGKLARRLEIDVVLIQYITLSYVSDYVKRQVPAARTIVDTHDVMHLRFHEFAEAGSMSWLNISADEERETLDLCDAAIAISEQDQTALQMLVPGKPVLKATYALPCNAVQVSDRAPSDTTTLGFIGTDGEANRLGLGLFLHECWPRLTGHLGNSIRVRIAGPVDRRSFETDSQPNIEFVGAVDNLADFYSSIDIAINPATIRSGFKIKSLESLSWGVPLVTTTAGIAGMSETIGHGASVADEWHDFATAIILLVEDRQYRRQASFAALESVKTFFSPETVYADLVSWMGSTP